MVSTSLTVLGWIVTLTLFISVFSSLYKDYIRSTGWLLLSVFLLSLTPHFLFVEKSIFEAVLAVLGSGIAIKLSVFTFSSKYGFEKIAQWISVTGLITLAIETIPQFRYYLISAVADQTVILLKMLGYGVRTKPATEGWLIIFYNTQPVLETRLIAACTGIGSIAIFVGLSAVLDTSIRNRLSIALISTVVIYILNIIRNVFIAASYGGQKLQIYPTVVQSIFGGQRQLVSYYIADKIVSQFLSVIVIVCLGIYILKYTSKEDKLTQELISVYNSVRKF